MTGAAQQCSDCDLLDRYSCAGTTGVKSGTAGLERLLGNVLIMMKVSVDILCAEE